LIQFNEIYLILLTILRADISMNEPLNLSDHARTEIERMIDDGTLLPGDSIEERSIAAKFSMSRTPVREAIQQLQVQGLVEIVPRQGIYVARMSIKSLLGMFELLAEMESVCAKFAARRISHSEIPELLSALNDCKLAYENDDVEAYDAANNKFHALIYAASKNRYVVEQVKLLRRRTQAYRRHAFLQRGRMKISFLDHERITNAICAGDSLTAASEMLAHISVGGQSFSEFVSQVPEELLEPAR
jgi:DNA-binding GntR family transcriptional regulator